MKIGFIGLGIMGKPMAANLVKAGHQLVVSSRNQAADELVELGASTASTPREIATEVELVITMLPNSPQSGTWRSGRGASSKPPGRI